MRVYNETGKLKTPELRITRPISALLIKTSKPLEDLNAEKITIFIEKANGNNVELATNISLKAFMLSSTVGENGVFTAKDDLTTALCEIGDEGAVGLAENESVKVEMSGLTSTATYSINGIEAPVVSDTVIKHDRKVVLNQDVQRQYDVSSYESSVIENVSSIDEIHITYNNGEVVKHYPEELISIANDLDILINVGKDGTIDTQCGNIVTFPLIGVDRIEIFKSDDSKSITLTLKDADVAY